MFRARLANYLLFVIVARKKASITRLGRFFTQEYKLCDEIIFYIRKKSLYYEAHKLVVI